jgi:hypothetical protein
MRTLYTSRRSEKHSNRVQEGVSFMKESPRWFKNLSEVVSEVNSGIVSGVRGPHLLKHSQGLHQVL